MDDLDEENQFNDCSEVSDDDDMQNMIKNRDYYENIITQQLSNGLFKTKSYNNWKKENVVDSLILKENSDLYNLLVCKDKAIIPKLDLNSINNNDQQNSPKKMKQSKNQQSSSKKKPPLLPISHNRKQSSIFLKEQNNDFSSILCNQSN